MHLVETMVMAPNNCMVCGRGNTPDGQTGIVGPFLDLAMEYNWGDSGYLCGDCVGQAAVHFGWISPDREKEQKHEIERLKKEIHDLQADMDRRRLKEKRAIAAVRSR